MHYWILKSFFLSFLRPIWTSPSKSIGYLMRKMSQNERKKERRQVTKSLKMEKMIKTSNSVIAIRLKYTSLKQID